MTTEQCRTVSKFLIEKKRLILTSMHHLNNLKHMQTDSRITSFLPLYSSFIFTQLPATDIPIIVLLVCLGTIIFIS